MFRDGTSRRNTVRNLCGQPVTVRMGLVGMVIWDSPIHKTCREKRVVLCTRRFPTFALKYVELPCLSISHLMQTTGVTNVFWDTPRTHLYGMSPHCCRKSSHSAQGSFSSPKVSQSGEPCEKMQRFFKCSKCEEAFVEGVASMPL